MVHREKSERPIDQRVVNTGGTVLLDGSILEPISTCGDSKRLQLATWGGSDAKIGTEFEHDGKLYRPAVLDRTILDALYLPTCVAPTEPSRQLLTDIGRVFASYTGVPERCVTLSTRAVLATWFDHNFSTAPWVSIVGPDSARGRQLLQLFHCFCRRALPVINPSLSTIRALPREWHFSFLIEQSTLSKETQRVLQAACRRGSYMLHHGQLLDVSAPCITFTDAPCLLSDGPLQGIEIPAIPDISEMALLTPEAERQIAADFQPRLLGYFFANNSAVKLSRMDLAAISFSMCEVTRNLAACTPGDVSLQTEIVKALQVQDDATRVARWTDEDVVLIESLLAHCHGGERGAYIGEIAETAEHILAERGDPKKLNARAAGARLRWMQFAPEPRDRTGYRLRFSEDARLLMHRLAYAYGVPGVQDGIVRCEHCRGGKEAAVAGGPTRTETN